LLDLLLAFIAQIGSKIQNILSNSRESCHVLFIVEKKRPFFTCSNKDLQSEIDHELDKRLWVSTSMNDSSLFNFLWRKIL